MLSKSALVLTSFDLRPAQAAPDSGPAIAKQNGADEFSAQRKRRRGGVHPGVPLAAFGMIAGTIAGIAAAERRREYYERPYAYGTPYGYAPQVYAQPYGYEQPYGYAPRVYHHPGYGAHPQAVYPGYGPPVNGRGNEAPQSPGAM
jgi:hypothetical protein